MSKSLYRLKRAPRITSCNFNIKQPEKSEEKVLSAECAFGVGINYVKKENIINVRLSVEMDDKYYPFSFDVVTELQLIVPEDAGETDNKVSNKAKEIAILTGCPYLFSFLGDFIAEITRKGCGKPFYIPLLDIEDAAKQGFSEPSE